MLLKRKVSPSSSPSPEHHPSIVINSCILSSLYPSLASRGTALIRSLNYVWAVLSSSSVQIFNFTGICLVMSNLVAGLGSVGRVDYHLWLFDPCFWFLAFGIHASRCDGGAGKSSCGDTVQLLLLRGPHIDDIYDFSCVYAAVYELLCVGGSK